MYKSLCIVDNTLYIAKCSFCSLLEYLSYSLSIPVDTLVTYPQGRLIFRGNYLKGEGTYLLVGSDSIYQAIPHLNFLNTEKTRVLFGKEKIETKSLKIDNINFLVIQDDVYDFDDLQVEPL